ncbi:MAG: hypothetical protein ACR2GY_00765, partial [Phycisphaerales bacterium]
VRGFVARRCVVERTLCPSIWYNRGMTAEFPTEVLTEIATRMEMFEAGASIANTGTGARREGGDFEKLVYQFWSASASYCVERGAKTEWVPGPRSRLWLRLIVDDRAVFIPTLEPLSGSSGRSPKGWLDLDFLVDDLIAAYPGQAEAVNRYAPTTGPYAHEKYPEQFSRMKTKFDDTIVLEEAGVLKEKILLEYKSSKSSKGRQIDGNAHERLSFQIMQYLEVATRFTRCSLAVVTNGSFARYRNKYHVNFHVQADRLASFRWFEMDHLCTTSEYARLFNRLVSWLFNDAPAEDHPKS